MDIAQIRKLIKLVQSSDVTEIEVSDGEHSVRISRQSTAHPAPAAPVAVTAPASIATTATAGSKPVAAAAEEDPADHPHAVKSPMVGTFYRAPSPDAEPFVREGQKVSKGDVLCIIEAMKLMNEIEAEYDGVVEKILAENASPIEYGQALFIITPA